MIQRLKNKLLINDIFKYDAIILLMGVNNEMSRGFNKEVSVNFPDVKIKEAKNRYGDKRKYGTVKVIHSDKNVTFLIVYCLKKNVIDIELFKQCIEHIDGCYHGNKIALSLPEEINYGFMDKCNNDFYIYDDPNDDFNLKYYRKFNELRNKYKNLTINKTEYLELKNKLEWERINGIFEEMPDGWRPKKKNLFEFLKR